MLEAQISIKSADLPSSGDKNVYISAAIDTINVTNTGANYSWDFSYLKASANNVLSYKDPYNISLLYLTYYGDVTDTVLGGTLSGLGFFKNSSSAYKRQALLFDVPIVNLRVPVPYSNPDIEYVLPLKYGNSDDSCSFSGSISIPKVGSIKVNGTRHNTIDGYGTIKTPFGTFSCVRIKSVITETDSIYTNIPSNRVEYKWLANGAKVPIMEVIVSAGGFIKQIYYKDSMRNINSPLAPPVNFNANDTNVYIGDTVKFTNSTTDPLGVYSYAWSISPGTFNFVDSTNASSKAPHVTFSDTGFYSVSLDATIPIVNIKGSKVKSNYIHVKKLGKPVVDFYADRVNPTTANVVHFTDNSTNAPTQWLWLFSPSTITYMNGTSSSSQNPNVRFDSVGKYTVTLIATNRIGSALNNKTDYISVSKSLGIAANFELSAKIKVYPNPAQSIINITWEDLKGELISEINIYNNNGLLLQNIHISSMQDKVHLDLSYLPNGTYYLVLKGKDAIYAKSIIKN